MNRSAIFISVSVITVSCSMMFMHAAIQVSNLKRNPRLFWQDARNTWCKSEVFNTMKDLHVKYSIEFGKNDQNLLKYSRCIWVRRPWISKNICAVSRSLFWPEYLAFCVVWFYLSCLKITLVCTFTRSPVWRQFVARFTATAVASISVLTFMFAGVFSSLTFVSVCRWQ